MSLYSKTVEYINNNDEYFRIFDINKYVYENNTKSSSVGQYVFNLYLCGFLKQSGQIESIYKRVKYIPSYITTILINKWSTTISDENNERHKVVNEYCKLQDRKLKIKKLLNVSI